MATSSSFAHRLLIAGGFAVAVSAAPVLATLAVPTGPGSPALAQCPVGEILDTASGACKPDTDPSAGGLNPVDPGITGLQPGGITSNQPGNVGRLPEINGIPCNGDNTGLCIGLEQQNAATSHIPHVPSGVTG